MQNAIRLLWLVPPLLAGALALRAWTGEPAGGDAGATGSLSVVLAPRRQAVLSAEVSARILRFHHELGESFAAGDPLAALDDFFYQANREKAEAAARAADAALDSAEKLFQTNSTSALDLAVARREAALARANLRMAARDVESCTVRAPFAGKVVKLLANEHEWVRQGDRLLAVAEDSTLRAQFLAPAAALRSLAVGRIVRVAVAETGTAVSARIAQIGAEADPASGTVEVVAEIDNRDGKLRAGLTGRVALADVEAR